MPSIRYEVEKPFDEKLRRAKELIHIFAGLARDKACVSCSFGKDSMVVLWLALQESKRIAVIFNNTGVQYKDTYEFKEQIVRDWDLKRLIETKPVKSFWQVAEEHGLPDSDKTKEKCCYYLKEKPFRDAIKEHGFTIAFSGLTAIESRQRMFTACQRGQEYYSRKDGVTKVHPIMFWTPGEVVEFSHRVRIPVNPAYEKYGIDRLGCVPCTSHKFWREQLAKTNLKLYQFIQEKYFHQKVFGGSNPLGLVVGGEEAKEAQQ